METLKSQATADAEIFKETYKKQQKEFVEKLKEQQDAISQNASNMEEIFRSTQDLSEISVSIKSLADKSRENSNRLDQIVDMIESGVYRTTSEKWINILNIAIKIVAILAFVMFAYEFVIKYIIK